MFELIFFGVFLFFALIFALCGMLKGRKYKFQYSLSRIIMVVLSAVISMALAALLAWLLGGLLFNIVKGFLPSDGIGKLLESVPSAPDAFKALIAMLIAPIIFFALFLIVKAILNCFSGPLCKLFMKIGKKKSVESVAEEASVAEATEEAIEKTPSEAATDEEAVAETIETSVETEGKGGENPKKEKKKHAKRKAFLSDRKFDPAGAICGAVCGFLIYIVLLIPTVGTVSSANSVVRLAGASDDGVLKTVCEISDAAADNVGAKTVKVLGGDLIYSGLTTYPVNGRMASLKNETKLLNSVGNAVMAIADDKVSAKDSADALRCVSDTFEETTVLPMLLSELLSAASDDWSRGEEFCGIACPSLGANFDVVVQDLMRIMKDSNYDTISADVRTIVNSLALFVENDAFGAVKTEGGVSNILKNEPLISGVMLEMLENERLSPLVNSITNMGMSVLTKQLELPVDDAAMYDGFIQDISSEYIRIKSGGLGAKETVDNLSSSVADVYDDYGIAISGGVSTCIATDMVNQLSSGDTEEIKKFFSTQIGNSNTMDSGNGNGVMYLSASENGNAKALSTVDKIAKRVSSDTTLDALKGIVKEELSATMSDIGDEALDELASEIADGMYKDVKDGALKYKTAAFNGVAEFGKNSVRLNQGDLKIEATVITDKAKEANSIAKTFGSVFAVVDELKGEFDIGNIVESFGPVLDSASDCETIGATHAATLLTAILQSDTVRGNVGFSMIQATDLAGSINSNSAKDGESYTTLLKSLGNTVEIIQESSKEGSDTTEAISSLMKDMTPASAEVLQQMSTPETVKKHGVAEESAGPVSDMLSDMFGNMADAKESGMSDEEYAKESAAVNDLMSVAMSAGKSSDKSTFGEDSATGITASEFVDRATNSTVISETVVNAVYADGSETAKSDPLNSGRELADEEKAELVSALDTKWKEQLSSSSDAEANAEYQKVLTSIAALVNVDVSFSDNNVSATK